MVNRVATSLILLCPILPFGEEALDELWPFLLVRLYALAQEQLADLRYSPLFFIGNLLDVLA